MEEKSEYILKIIEEDGDSFAQRAEMYYRKRPELVNFVEDSFRGYRALAERYDHLSRELQSANRTIATIYPEQVHLAMDDEDEENFPTTPTPSSDPKKPSKDLPAAPKLNIPKIPKQKNSKAPARLMSKKGLLKFSVPTTAAATTSGMSKAEALEEIDKVQKKILGLQTEKEFVKSSYESGLAKYWEIEEQVTEMQAKVNILQDEFGIGTFIEDDEARTLMGAAALKSCQETLIRLQEKQEQSNEELRVEYQRIKEAHEKLEILKENLGNDTSRIDLPENLELESTSRSDIKDLDQKVDSIEQERHNLELLRAKIKEQLQENSSASLIMSELAEKIDELVDKVITLETAVSSQNAMVKGLISETNELQTHLQSLEEDRESLIEGSDSKSNKIRELEQELHRIQNLHQNAKDQNSNLQIHFIEASFNVDHLSEKLLTVKQDEEVDHKVPFKELRTVTGVDPEKEFQEHEELVSVDNRFNLSNHPVDLSHEGQVRAVPDSKPEKEFEGNEAMITDVHDSKISKDASMGEISKEDSIADHSPSVRTEDDNPEKNFQENEETMAHGYDSEISRSVRVEGEAKRDEVPDQSSCIKGEEENFTKSDLSNCLDDLLVKGQAISVHDDNLVKGLKEHKVDKVITKDVKMEDKEKKEDSSYYHPVKAEEENSFQFNPFYCLEEISVKGQFGAVFGTDSEGFKEHGDIKAPANDPVISTDAKTEKGEKNRDNQDLTASIKDEEENNVQSSPSNPFDNPPRNEQVRAAQDVVPERMLKEQQSVMGADNEEENHVQSNPSNQEKDEKQNTSQKADTGLNVESQELETEDEDQPNWRQLFVNGLDDREEILLQQYTSILRTYKEAKKQLGEMEKKNHDSLFNSATQIKELKNANALKDAEIQSLHKKLNLIHVSPDETPDTSSTDLSPSQQGGSHENLAREEPTTSPNSDQKQVSDLLDEQKVESLERKEESTAPEPPTINSPRKDEGGEEKVISIEEPHTASMIEEKFRSDIDGLLEENIDFWMRFSTSFHQIQKFKTSVQDLQAELTELREKRQQDGKTKHQSMNSDVRPIYTHLREIQTELSLWLEHNALLEHDFENRLSSLSSIQEEISRLSNAGSKEEETQLTDYQAAKFQGEVLNMKQENNKVAYELQLGLECVKELQVEIAKTVSDLEQELGVSASKNQQTKHSSIRSRMPLRSFLFGARLKKQKQSLFHCMNPALQKQYSDLNSLPK